MAELSDSERGQLADAMERIASKLKDKAYYFRRNQAQYTAKDLYAWGNELRSLSDQV